MFSLFFSALSSRCVINAQRKARRTTFFSVWGQRFTRCAQIQMHSCPTSSRTTKPCLCSTTTEFPSMSTPQVSQTQVDHICIVCLPGTNSPFTLCVCVCVRPRVDQYWALPFSWYEDIHGYSCTDCQQRMACMYSMCTLHRRPVQS